MIAFKVVLVVLFTFLILNWMAPCSKCPSGLADLVPFSQSSPSRAYDVLALLMCIATIVSCGKIYFRRRSENEEDEYFFQRRTSFKWDNVLAIVGFIALPFVIWFFISEVSLKPFEDVPLLGLCCRSCDMISLLFLSVILGAVLLLVRVVRE